MAKFNLMLMGGEFMNTIRMEFEMPSEILNYVSKNDKDYNDKVKELMIYALIRDGKISYGKGAEMLGINKFDLVTALGKLGIAYFNETIEEVEDDLMALDKIEGGQVYDNRRNLSRRVKNN